MTWWPRCAAGGRCTGVDGFNCWIEVTDERFAAEYLASWGIGVQPGSVFHLRPPVQDHLRLTAATVAEDVDEIADRVAEAAGTPTEGLVRRGSAPRRIAHV